MRQLIMGALFVAAVTTLALSLFPGDRASATGAQSASLR